MFTLHSCMHNARPSMYQRRQCCSSSHFLKCYNVKGTLQESQLTLPHCIGLRWALYGLYIFYFVSYRQATSWLVYFTLQFTLSRCIPALTRFGLAPQFALHNIVFHAFAASNHHCQRDPKHLHPVRQLRKDLKFLI